MPAIANAEEIDVLVGEEVHVSTEEQTSDNAELIESLEMLIATVPKYYETYYTETSAAAVTLALDSIPSDTELEMLSGSELDELYTNLDTAIQNLCYKTGTVPQVYISTADGVGNTIVKANGYVSTEIAIVDTDSSVLSASNGQIKVRGNTTASAEKKPFNIKFASKQNVLGMGKAKKWCLLANCFDPTLMRNYLAIDWASEMGLDYTSEQRYVELWVDGVYKGCYVLMEAVEAGSTRVDIDTDAGDFMLEEETSRTESDVTYVVASNGLRFALGEPEEPTEEQLSYVQERVDELAEALESGDFTNVEELIDVESFTKFYLLNEFMKTVDLEYSSVYFYYKNDKWYAGPAWDYDLSSGNASSSYYVNYYDADEKSSTGIWANKTWFKYLLDYSEFKECVKEEFLLQSDYLQKLYADGGYIDQLVKQYGDIFEKNYTDAGWNPALAYYVYQRTPDATFEENVDYLKNWLEERYEFLNTYWLENEPAEIYEVCEDISVEAGERVSFWIKTGGSELTYQWFYKKAGASEWSTWVGYTDQKFSINSNASWDGMQVYCQVASGDGTVVNSDIVTVHILQAPVIMDQSGDFCTAVGQKVTFYVNASTTSETELSYIWYCKRSTDKTWTNWTISDKTSFVTKAQSTWDGLQVFCRVTDGYGVSTDSEVMTVTLSMLPVITKQMEDIVTAVNDKVTFSVEAVTDSGTELTYGWYIKRSGSDTWSKWTISEASTFTTRARATWAGLQVCCEVTDGNGNSVKTDPITITIVDPPVITKQPVDIIGAVNEKATFSVEAVSSSGGECTYQWYYKRVNSTSWVKWTISDQPTFTKRIRSTWAGLQVYCKVTDENGFTTDSNVITIQVTE